MKVSPRDADGFSRSPPPDVRAILFYGPDSGLVSERAEAAARAVAADIADPFSVVTLDAAALEADPVRLGDEAAALALGAQRRVVWLRAAKDRAAAAVATALAMPWESLVILEAGDLSPRSKLRTLFEGADDAAAVACYLDDAGALAALARQTLAEAGIEAEPGVVDWLSGNLGSDRKVTRMELEKLTLYAGDAKRITLEDAQAVVGDSALVTVDDVVYATFGGDMEALVRALARARFEGVTPIAVIRGAFAHLTRLEEAAAAAANGRPADRIAKDLRVFFKRQAAFGSQIRRWPAARLARGRAELVQTELDCKSTNLPADEVCERGLMRLAAIART